MLKEAIGTGQTIEQAKEDAINQLGLSAEDEYQIEIIELPHKKTLGIFGGSPAKVRVYIDDGETENNDIFDVKQEIKNSFKSESDENKEEIKSDVKLEPVYSIEEAEKASEYVKSILENLGVENCKIDVQPEEETMRLILSGDNISQAVSYTHL